MNRFRVFSPERETLDLADAQKFGCRARSRFFVVQAEGRFDFCHFRSPSAAWGPKRHYVGWDVSALRAAVFLVWRWVFCILCVTNVALREFHAP